MTENEPKTPPNGGVTPTELEKQIAISKEQSMTFRERSLILENLL